MTSRRRKALVLVATLGLAALWWRRRVRGGVRGPGDGGGDLSGDREPLVPVPPTLVDAAAAVPGD